MPNEGGTEMKKDKVLLLFAGFSGILAFVLSKFITLKSPADKFGSTVYEEYSSKFNRGNHNKK